MSAVMTIMRPRNVASATASLRKNISDLEYVSKLRTENAAKKAAKIAQIEAERSEDEHEANAAAGLAEKLRTLFFGDSTIGDA